MSTSSPLPPRPLSPPSPSSKNNTRKNSPTNNNIIINSRGSSLSPSGSPRVGAIQKQPSLLRTNSANSSNNQNDSKQNQTHHHRNRQKQKRRLLLLQQQQKQAEEAKNASKGKPQLIRPRRAMDLWRRAEKIIVAKSLYASVARIPFGLERLSDFREYFMDDLGMYERELSEDEFIDTFQKALAGRRFSRQELSQWFKDIDVDCGDSVSWDEFSTFVLTQTKIEQKLARDMDRARDFVPDISYPLSTQAHHKHPSNFLLVLGSPKFQGLPERNTNNNNNDNKKKKKSSPPPASSSSSEGENDDNDDNQSDDDEEEEDKLLSSHGLLTILSADSEGQIKFWSKRDHDIEEACGRPAAEPHLVSTFENVSNEVQGISSSASGNNNSSNASSIISNMILKRKMAEEKKNSRESSSSSSPLALEEGSNKNHLFSEISGVVLEASTKKSIVTNNSNTNNNSSNGTIDSYVTLNKRKQIASGANVVGSGNGGGMKFSPIVDLVTTTEGTDGNFFVLGSDRTINVFNVRANKLTLRFKGYPTAASRFIRATIGSERGVFASEPRDGVPLVRLLDMDDFPSSCVVARPGYFASTAARDPSITFQGDEVFIFGMQNGDVVIYVTERHTIRALRNPVKIFGEPQQQQQNEKEENENKTKNKNDHQQNGDSLLQSTQRVVYGPKLHTNRIHKMLYSPAFGGLITASWDGTMKITDLETGKINFTFDGVAHHFTVATDFAPNNRSRKKNNSQNLHGSGIPVTSCGFGSGEEDIDVAELRHRSPITDFAVNDRDHLIATVACEHQVLLWSPALAAHPIGVLKSDRSKMIAVCFAPEHFLAITLDQVGGVVRVWDLRTNTQRQFFHFEDHELAPPETRLEIPRKLSFEPRTGTLVASKRSPCTWTLRRRIAASCIHNDAIITSCLADSATGGGWIFTCDSSEVAAFSIRRGVRRLMFVPFQMTIADPSINKNTKKSNNGNNTDANSSSTAATASAASSSEVDNANITSNPLAAIGLDRHERRIYFCSKNGLCRVFNARTGMLLGQMKPKHFRSATVETGDVIAVVPLTSDDKATRIIAIITQSEIHFVWDSFDARLGARELGNKHKGHRYFRIRDQIAPSGGPSGHERIEPKIVHVVRGVNPDDKTFVPLLLVGLEDGRIVVVNSVTTSVTHVVRGTDKRIFVNGDAMKNAPAADDDHGDRDQKNSNKPKFIDLQQKLSAPEELIQRHAKEKETEKYQMNEAFTGEMRIEDMSIVRSKDLLIVVFENSSLIEMWNVRYFHHIVSRVSWPVNMIPKNMPTTSNSPPPEMMTMSMKFSASNNFSSSSSFQVNNGDDGDDYESSMSKNPESPSANLNNNKKKKKLRPPAPCFTCITSDGRGEVMFAGDIHGCIYVFDITAINPTGSTDHWLRMPESTNNNNTNSSSSSNNNPHQQQHALTAGMLAGALNTSTKKKAFFTSIARRAGLAAKQEKIFEMRKTAARRPKNVGPQTICMRLLKVFRAHSDAVVKLTYSDSSQRLISQGADLVVHCWTGIGKYVGFFGPTEPFRSSNLSDLYKSSRKNHKKNNDEKQGKEEEASLEKHTTTDFSHQNRHRGSANDPLIQAAILTQEEREDVPQVILVERIQLKNPPPPALPLRKGKNRRNDNDHDENENENEWFDESINNELHPKIVSPRPEEQQKQRSSKNMKNNAVFDEEYISVVQPEIDFMRIEASLDYSEFATKITQESHQHHHQQSSSSFLSKVKTTTFSPKLCADAGSASIAIKLALGGNSAKIAKDVTHTKNEEEEENSEENKPSAPALALVKASMLMLRKDKKETTTTGENLSSSPLILPKLLSPSHNNNNKDNNTVDGGFFLTSTTDVAIPTTPLHHHQQQGKNTSVLTLMNTDDDDSSPHHLRLHDNNISKTPQPSSSPTMKRNFSKNLELFPSSHCAVNAPLPPLLASHSRLTPTLQRGSPTYHMKKITSAFDQRQIEKEKLMLMGLISSSSDANNNNNNNSSSPSSAFARASPENNNNDRFNTDVTSLKRRHEKQQSHLQIMPSALRTPGGVKKIIGEHKKEQRSQQRLRQKSSAFAAAAAASMGNDEEKDNEEDKQQQQQSEFLEIDPRSALRIPIERLDYLDEKPKRHLLTGMGSSMMKKK